jgi:hypothetical protein
MSNIEMQRLQSGSTMLRSSTNISLRSTTPAPSTLYAARGRPIPISANSPTGSTVKAFSSAISTRGLIRICPGLASSRSREADIGHCRLRHSQASFKGDGA